GLRDVRPGFAILVRGLGAIRARVLPIVRLLVALTIWSNPDRSQLHSPNLFWISLARYLPVENFGITLALTLAALVLFFAWALYRSLLPPDKRSEFRTKLPAWGAGVLVLIAAAFFCELQPFVVAGMFDIADAKAGVEPGVFLALITSWVKTLAAFATPVAAAVTLFRQQFGDLVKATTAASGWMAQLASVATKAAVWIAGAALPLLIWVGYLYLCYWGIINDEAQSPVGRGTHTPAWLLRASQVTSELIVGRVVERPVALLYLACGVLLLLLSWLLRPNANSLHRLYRDRLSKAFLFDPDNRNGEPPAA